MSLELRDGKRMSDRVALDYAAYYGVHLIVFACLLSSEMHIVVVTEWQ